MSRLPNADRREKGNGIDSRRERTPPAPNFPGRLGPSGSVEIPEDSRLVATVRDEWGLPRKTFARLSASSERALADWEAGKALTDGVRRKMTELHYLYLSLARVIEPAFLARWLETPNHKVFGGLKPLEVIERGEIHRIWGMICELELGRPV
jgi:hypothetical protein